MLIPKELKADSVEKVIGNILNKACGETGCPSTTCSDCALYTPENFMAHLKEVKESGDG